MAALLAVEPHLKKDPVAAAYFYDAAGKPWPAGHVLRNPELAAVLQGIADRGPAALLQGEVGQAIARKVQGHPSNPGTLNTQDLARYQPLVREPLCFDYAVKATARDYRICGMPPPSSGAIAIGQILGILSHTSAASLPLATGTGSAPDTAAPTPSADWLHLYTDASRLAFADRDRRLTEPFRARETKL